MKKTFIIAIQENSNNIDENCSREIISIKNVKSSFYLLSIYWIAIVTANIRNVTKVKLQYIIFSMF